MRSTGTASHNTPDQCVKQRKPNFCRDCNSRRAIAVIPRKGATEGSRTRFSIHHKGVSACADKAPQVRGASPPSRGASASTRRAPDAPSNAAIASALQKIALRNALPLNKGAA